MDEKEGKQSSSLTYQNPMKKQKDGGETELSAAAIVDFVDTSADDSKNTSSDQVSDQTSCWKAFFCDSYTPVDDIILAQERSRLNKQLAAEATGPAGDRSFTYYCVELLLCLFPVKMPEVLRRCRQTIWIFIAYQISFVGLIIWMYPFYPSLEYMCADQGNHLNDASFKYGRFGCPAVAALLGNKSLTVVQEMNILASFHQTIGAQRSSPYNNNEWLNVSFPILPGDKEKIAKFLIWKSQTRGAFLDVLSIIGLCMYIITAFAIILAFHCRFQESDPDELLYPPLLEYEPGDSLMKAS
mgnify:CR=1 FL=1